MARNRGRRNSSLSSLGSEEPENVVTSQSATGEFAQVSGVSEPEALAPDSVPSPPVAEEPTPTPNGGAEALVGDVLSDSVAEQNATPASAEPVRPAAPIRPTVSRPAPRAPSVKEQYLDIVDKINNPRENNLLTKEDIDKLKSIIEENRDSPDFPNWVDENNNFSTALLEVIRVGKFTPKEVSSIGDHIITALGKNEQAKTQAIESIHSVFQGDEHSEAYKMSTALKNALGIPDEAKATVDASAPASGTPSTTPSPDTTPVPNNAAATIEGTNTVDAVGNEIKEPDRKLTNTASSLRDIFEQRMHEASLQAKLIDQQKAEEAEALRLQAGRQEQPSQPRGFFGTLAAGIASRLQSGPRTKEQVAAAIDIQTRLGSPVSTRARAQIEDALLSSRERIHRMEARKIEAQRIREDFINVQKELSNKSQALFQDRDYLGKKIAELSAKGEALAFSEPGAQSAVDDYMQRQNELKGGLTSLVHDSIEDRKEAVDNMNMFNSKVDFLDKANLISNDEKKLLAQGGEELTTELGAIQGIAEDTGLTGPKEQEESLKQKMREAAEKLQKMLQKMIQKLFGGLSRSGPSMG